jgi:hypothetical protein
MSITPPLPELLYSGRAFRPRPGRPLRSGACPFPCRHTAQLATPDAPGCVPAGRAGIWAFAAPGPSLSENRPRNFAPAAFLRPGPTLGSYGLPVVRIALQGLGPSAGRLRRPCHPGATGRAIAAFQPGGVGQPVALFPPPADDRHAAVAPSAAVAAIAGVAADVLIGCLAATVGRSDGAISSMSRWC